MTTSPTWRPPPESTTLGRDALHVWRVPLDIDPDGVDTLAGFLNADESVRAARFRFRRDRRRFVAARGQLRLVLSPYLDRAPEAIVFQYGPRGKPEVPSLQFNLSHAGEVALVAVSRSCRVGVDVEPVRALADADAIVDRFFSAREVAEYRALSDEDRPRAFVACWTRKEAFVKAIGEGLSHPLDAFDVTVHPDAPARLLATRHDPRAAAHWHMRSLPVGEGYAATIVAERPSAALTCFEVSAVHDLISAPHALHHA